MVAKSFVKSKTVYLRYLPSDNTGLMACTAKGYSIKKIKWNSGQLPDSTAFKNQSPIIIKPTDKESPEWDVMINKYPEAGFLYNYLYEPKNNNSSPEMAFGLAMLSCDFNVDLAKLCGLYLKEEMIEETTYAYMIQPADGKLKKTIAPAIIIVKASKDDELKNIDSLKIKTRKKEVKLIWNEKQLKPYYAGYFIERSEDGKNFVQRNNKPHIQVSTQYEKNKTDIYYNDTITEYGKTYYYRIRGLGYFGLYGNYSNIVKCVLIKPLEEFPQADSVQLIKDTALQVNWHMPQGYNLKELKGYNIYKSIKVDSGYQKLNKQLISAESKNYIDISPYPTNYYKILAYSIYGDSAYSHPMMGIFPDKKPPKTPVGFKGKIDTMGRVLLTWKPNKETDLMGYRIFRNNAANEERVEISKRIINDTIYDDTITLQTLTEEVFYFITAVDKVYNNSKFSQPIKLKRPDKIKPVEAQFVSMIHNDSAIIAKWIPSSSKDVIKHELWRKKAENTFEKIREWNISDKTDSIIDAKLEYGNYYTYQIKVFDDDGNFSISTPMTHYYDARVRKAIEKIKTEVNLEKKSIVLKWEYPQNELYNFVIYKAKKGEPLKIVKTLKPDVFMYEDKQLNVGNTYIYKLKANFKSGAESYLSKEILVEF